MTAVVVDTNVASFRFKRDSRSALYQRHLVGRTLYLSAMTVAELERWALSNNWGAARIARLAGFVHRFVIVDTDRDICRTWAEISNEADRSGRPIDCADAWIAGTAVALNLPLVTHNPSDFAGVSRLTLITEAP